LVKLKRVEINKRRGKVLVTRNLIKEEIDKVQDSHREILYRIVKVLETPSNSESLSIPKDIKTSNWKEFIESTYGCMADDPIYKDGQEQR
jgi:hypothetical protein